jgi:hypothetical protein
MAAALAAVMITPAFAADAENLLTIGAPSDLKSVPIVTDRKLSRMGILFNSF